MIWRPRARSSKLPLRMPSVGTLAYIGLKIPRHIAGASYGSESSLFQLLLHLRPLRLALGTTAQKGLQETFRRQTFPSWQAELTLPTMGDSFGTPTTGPTLY